MNASRKMRDCSSMYCSERVLFASRYVRRLWIDLKNDSCVEGTAGLGCVGDARACDCDCDCATTLTAVLLLVGLEAEAVEARALYRSLQG
jgi:hypothetical protein